MRLDDLDADARLELQHGAGPATAGDDLPQMVVRLDDVAGDGNVADPMQEAAGFVLRTPQDDAPRGFWGKVTRSLRGQQPHPEHVLQSMPIGVADGAASAEADDGAQRAEGAQAFVAPPPASPSVAPPAAPSFAGRLAGLLPKRPASTSSAGGQSATPRGTPPARQRNFAPYFGGAIIAFLALAVLIAQLRDKAPTPPPTDAQTKVREQTAALLGAATPVDPATPKVATTPELAEPAPSATARPPVPEIPKSGGDRYGTMLDQIKDGRVLPPAGTEPVPLPTKVQPVAGASTPQPLPRLAPEIPPKRVGLDVEFFEGAAVPASRRPADPLAGRVASASLRSGAVRPQTHTLARIAKVDGEWIAFVRAPGEFGWWAAPGDRLPNGWTVVEVTASTVRLNGPEGEIEELR